jgi:S1-C subfamily serine protease
MRPLETKGQALTGSRLTLFVAGVCTTLVVLLVLAVLGVVPLHTGRTTVVTAAGTGTETVQASHASGLSAEQLYQRCAPGVVEIIATFPGSSVNAGFFEIPTGPTQALGSGFVVSRSGYILTNAHVVSDSGQTVKHVQVIFKGEGTTTRQVSGTVIGCDATSDVALIKVDPAKVGHLDVLALGDSSAVVPGEPVVAIGNPQGYAFSISQGIVSATDRNLQSPNGSVIAGGIQTDAAINEGNSGGPLIDTAGHVIGINEQIATQSGGSEGLGFAVPIDTAVSVMNELHTYGKATYAWLGVSGQSITPDLAQLLHLPISQGVLVAQVLAHSPAATAGLQGATGTRTIQGQTYKTGGDIITTFDGVALASMQQLAGLIMAKRPGAIVTLGFLRGATSKTVRITLATKPSSI